MSVRRSTRIIAVISGFILLAAGFGLLIPAHETVDGVDAHNLIASRGAEYVFPVRTAFVQQGPLRTWVRASGYLRSGRSVAVSSRISARVEEVRLRDGMTLLGGDTAVIFEREAFRLAHERARLTLLGAQIEYKSLVASPYLTTPDSARRAQEIRGAEERFAASLARHGCGDMSEDEFAIEEREYEATRAYLSARREDVVSHRSGLATAREIAERARLEYEGTIICAPFKGAVTNCMVTPGLLVSPGQVLFTLVDLSSQSVEAEVIESDITNIRVGSPAVITVHAFERSPVRGRVASINPVAEPGTGTVRVSVRPVMATGRSPEFRPGMLASVRIAAGADSAAVVVPCPALVYRDGRPVVFVVEHDRAVWRYVRPGGTNGEERGIMAGLAAGEQVIVEGQATLGHGAHVKVLEGEPADNRNRISYLPREPVPATNGALMRRAAQ